MYEIVIGRSEEDKQKFGLAGTVFLGKHYVKMGQSTSLSSDILLDVNRSHVVFVCGKRGSGKSYSLGVIAEGISNLPDEIAKNMSVLIFDTMGIFWTMKFPNQKDKILLKEWGLEAKPLDILIYTPAGFYQEYKEKGIPTDFPFSLKPAELSAADWCMTFDIDINSQHGVLLERIIHKLRHESDEFGLNEMIDDVQKDEKSDRHSKDIVENNLMRAKEWGIFSKKGTPIKDLAAPGKIVVLDISCYTTIPGASGIRALAIGIISQRLFMQRMTARKAEEYAATRKMVHYFAEEEERVLDKVPLVWIMVDEAHEFLPDKGRTTATDALITILREGREPGISLVLASQQPGKIHSDVITQADTVISHRLTAKMDVESLGKLMQSYMRKGLDQEINELPRVNGAAIVFDDMNEKIYPIKVRPRFTWHGGAAPTAIKEKKKEIEL